MHFTSWVETFKTVIPLEEAIKYNETSSNGTINDFLGLHSFALLTLKSLSFRDQSIISISFEESQTAIRFLCFWSGQIISSYIEKSHISALSSHDS